MQTRHFLQRHIAAYLTFYVLAMLAAMLLSLGVMSISIIQMANQREYTYKTYEIESLFETYRREGIDKAFAAGDGMVVYMEYLNAKRQVKDEIYSPKGFGYTYTEEAFREMLERDQEFMLYYPYADSEDVFVVYSPKLAGPTPIVDIVIYHILGFVALVGIWMVMLVFTVRNKFVRPVLLMKRAVEQVGEGELDVVIDYQSENELNVLKTAIEHMARTIHQQVTALKQAEEERKRMVLSLSHDIRTPLTNISGYAETLKTEPDLSQAEKNKAIDVIFNNTQRAKHLINGLFDYAKYDSDQLSVQNHPTDVVACLRDCVIHYYPDFELKGMKMSLQLPEKPILLPLDAALFDRLIGNLLANALRYADDTGKMTVKLNKGSQHVRIIIEDEGPGIPESIRESLFDPFVTGDEARTNRSGTGLGLTIAKRIAERLGGRLEWDQTYLKGVRWRIVLKYSEEN